MVILDTNIIIDHIRQEEGKETLLIKLVKERPKERLALSVLSIQELYAGKSTKNRKREAYLLATISLLAILPYNQKIAQQAGKIMRDLSSPIVFVDAAIAATAIENKAELLTLNRKDFENIKELNLIKL